MNGKQESEHKAKLEKVPDHVDIPRMRQRSVKIGDLSVNPMRF